MRRISTTYRVQTVYAGRKPGAARGGLLMSRKCEMESASDSGVRLTIFVAALLLFVTPVAFGQGQTRNRDEEPMSRAAQRVNWTSSSALNAVFRDKPSVKRFLNEVANQGDAIGIESIAKVLEYRFVDLNRDGWLELVALVGGRRP